MGAEQSSTQDRSGSEGADAQQYSKRCYYEILGVDHQASDEEIKKAYRRKALELHPDRNFGNVEYATKQFAEVQSAYQILSDAQERAWYDSHRDAILQRDGEDTDGGLPYDAQTTAKDIVKIISRFTPTMPFTDASDGFYGFLKTKFAAIAQEENAARYWEGLDSIVFPDFGGKTASYEEKVKPFYATWLSFSTQKTFSWKETYNYADAPDRKVRRLMEKENKRLREEAIKEFNDAVRSLVSFVRKRDPRYISNSQSEVERQKVLRDAAAAQAARSRAAHKAKLEVHVVPEWARTQNSDEGSDSGEVEETENEIFECALCKKTFKSENQWIAHEKSKKHIKAVQKVRRQIHKENKGFSLDKELQSEKVSRPSSADADENGWDNRWVESSSDLQTVNTLPEVPTGISLQDPMPEENTRPHSRSIDLKFGKGSSSEIDSEIDESGDDYASRKTVESPSSSLAGKDSKLNASPHYLDGTEQHLLANLNKLDMMNDTNDTSSQSGNDASRREGKAKRRRAKKGTEGIQATSGFVCETCKSTFSSKNRLFQHIDRDGHAQPVPKQSRRHRGRT